MIEKIICRRVITKNMGLCDCGDCSCEIYEDGSIQYKGKYAWQRSDRIRKPTFPQEYRAYKSELKESDYRKAMESMAFERNKIESGEDLLKERKSLELALDVVNSRISKIMEDLKNKEVQE